MRGNLKDFSPIGLFIDLIFFSILTKLLSELSPCLSETLPSSLEPGFFDGVCLMEALPSCVVRVDVVELRGLGLNRSREGRGHHKLVLAGVDRANRPLGPGRFSEKKLYMCTLYTTYQKRFDRPTWGSNPRP